MGIRAIHFGGTEVRGIVHISETDAIFRLDDGTPVAMCYHNYMGPDFRLPDDEPIYPDDTPEWDGLWRQFDGWWKAKGEKLYGGEK